MKIAVGSLNPAKVQAVKNVMQELGGQIVPIRVSSEVSDQPFSDEETLEGAIHRAENALFNTNSDIGIGLEGGVAFLHDQLFLCNWGALVSNEGKQFVAGGARIPLPSIVAKEVKSGKELGIVMDEYTKRHNVRSKEGAIGIFSNGMVDRDQMFEHLVKLLYGQYRYHSLGNKEPMEG